MSEFASVASKVLLKHCNFKLDATTSGKPVLVTRIERQGLVLTFKESCTSSNFLKLSLLDCSAAAVPFFADFAIFLVLSPTSCACSSIAWHASLDQPLILNIAAPRWASCSALRSRALATWSGCRSISARAAILSRATCSISCVRLAACSVTMPRTFVVKAGGSMHSPRLPREILEAIHKPLRSVLLSVGAEVT